jgi:hypothetical protein
MPFGFPVFVIAPEQAGIAVEHLISKLAGQAKDFLVLLVRMRVSTVFLQSFGANSANNLAKRGSLRSGSQYGSLFNWP